MQIIYRSNTKKMLSCYQDGKKIGLLKGPKASLEVKDDSILLLKESYRENSFVEWFLYLILFVMAIFSGLSFRAKNLKESLSIRRTYVITSQKGTMEINQDEINYSGDYKIRYHLGGLFAYMGLILGLLVLFISFFAYLVINKVSQSVSIWVALWIMVAITSIYLIWAISTILKIQSDIKE